MHKNAGLTIACGEYQSDPLLLLMCWRVAVAVAVQIVMPTVMQAAALVLLLQLELLYLIKIYVL